MKPQQIVFSLLAVIFLNFFHPPCMAQPRRAEISAATLQDKIRGGLLGHLLGDLNGLPHEMKYIDKPGDLMEYIPALPDGAWTDDDTDFEWVYLCAMQQRHRILLSPGEICQLWKKHINRYFWCANQYARQLMDLGIGPPLTGLVFINPWSDFNISGQFVSESWGLISPGMPQTACRIGLNYTRVAISGEPAQTTQLFDTMIARAFFTSDTNEIIREGINALDPHSRVREVVLDVSRWYREDPNHWKLTRQKVKEKYSLYQGEMRDRNGYELNTAAVIAALLYGKGDFVQTSLTAFNFGWDADNNAATAGTIVGVICGYQSLMSHDWQIKDRYRNTTRDDMPVDETMTTFGDRLISLAEENIIQHGGRRVPKNGKPHFSIMLEDSQNVEPLPDPALEFARWREKGKKEIEEGLQQQLSGKKQARAAYLAIGLGLAPHFKSQYPARWEKALQSLKGYPKLLQVLFFESPTPAGDQLRSRALAAGLSKPSSTIQLWR